MNIKKTKNEIKVITMSEKERNSIYNQVVFSIALNSISNVFNQDIHNNIDTIVFNGYIKDIDSSTGQDINPYIISVMVDKNIFNITDGIDGSFSVSPITIKEISSNRLIIQMTDRDWNGDDEFDYREWERTMTFTRME